MSPSPTHNSHKIKRQQEQRKKNARKEFKANFIIQKKWICLAADAAENHNKIMNLIEKYCYILMHILSRFRLAQTNKSFPYATQHLLACIINGICRMGVIKKTTLPILKNYMFSMERKKKNGALVESWCAQCLHKSEKGKGMKKRTALLKKKKMMGERKVVSGSIVRAMGEKSVICNNATK